MKNNVHTVKEMLWRAARTFIQAFIAYVAANMVAMLSGITEPEVFKQAVLGLIISAVSAGLAALMNLPTPIEQEADDGDSE